MNLSLLIFLSWDIVGRDKKTLTKIAVIYQVQSKNYYTLEKSQSIPYFYKLHHH